MKIVLRPRVQNEYGQDYRSSLVIERLALKPINLENEHILDKVNESEINLVITFDPEDAICSDDIMLLSKTIPIISHYQLQWNFQKSTAREIAKKTIDRSDAVIVPADFLKKYMEMKFPQKKIELINNGADEKIFNCSNLNERKIFKKKLNIPEDDFIFIYVGGLTKQKGFQILSELCKIITQNNHLLFYCKRSSSNEKEINKLKLINPQHIHYLPDDSYSSRRSHPVKLCDCLISSSLSEVAPMVVIEALLSGIRVLATDSTPFYKELPNVILEKRYLQLIDLPDKIKNLSWDILCLDSDAVPPILDSLIKYINDIEFIPDDERQLLSEIMVRGGYVASQMVNEYKKIYDEIST